VDSDFEGLAETEIDVDLDCINESVGSTLALIALGEETGDRDEEKEG